jgi:hypothetical protein
MGGALESAAQRQEIGLGGRNNDESEATTSKSKLVEKQRKINQCRNQETVGNASGSGRSTSGLPMVVEVLHGLHFGFLRAEAIPHGSSSKR